MTRLFLPLLFFLITANVSAQYFSLEQSNTHYYNFAEQEMLIHRLFRKGLIHEGIQLSENSRLEKSSLLQLTDSIRNEFLDCFAQYRFEHIFSDTVVSKYPLVSRKTYFHKDTNGNINYLLQVDIIFEGDDVEAEKFAPKIADISLRFNHKIEKPDASTLEAAFNPQIDEDMFPDLPPPPPPAPEKIGFTSDFPLEEMLFDDELSILIPEGYLSLSKAIDRTNGVYYFEHKDGNSSFEIRKVDKYIIKQKASYLERASKLVGVKIHRKMEPVKLGDLELTVFEATYFDKNPTDKEAWTKIFLDNHDSHWTITIRYPEEDRIATQGLRKRIIESIKSLRD